MNNEVIEMLQFCVDEIKKCSKMLEDMERRLDSETVSPRHNRWDENQEKILVQVVSLPYIDTLDKAHAQYNNYAKKYKVPERSEGAIRARLEKLGIKLGPREKLDKTSI